MLIPVSNAIHNGSCVIIEQKDPKCSIVGADLLGDVDCSSPAHWEGEEVNKGRDGVWNGKERR